MIETGTILQQRYKIDKQIGQGGMGAVYVATDERFGSTVAIKETLCMDDNFRKAIEREARLLNSLKHTALPRVSDHFEENNGMFLVMEFIPGEDVGSMLEDEKSIFSVEQVLKWADELLDALDYLHTQVMPVIHRDIKPQNLKLNSRGEMILLDFGLAKGNPTDAGHQTAAKSIFGYSRNYASLEQIQGTGTDPRSDLYSLAATLYHLLTRIAPEDALTRAMSVLSQKPDPLAPASFVNPSVPRGVAGVLQKAMDLNAGERPTSAVEMRQMLRESENYAYLAESTTIADRISDPAVFAQSTRLMPEATRPNFSDSNAKTEVLPSHLSQLTALRTSVSDEKINSTTASPPPKGRGMSVAAGALMMLLVGVVAAGGVYLVRPSVFGLGENDKKAEAPISSPVTADSTAVTNANSTQSANSSGTAETSGEAEATRSLSDSILPGDRDKAPETTKNLTKAANAAKAKPEEDEVVDIEIDDPDLPSGGVVVTQRDDDGTVKTMRVNPMRPNPNMQRPPPNGMQFPMPNIDMSRMTPLQRQKIMRAMRMNPKFRQMQQPPPRPTPPNPEN